MKRFLKRDFLMIAFGVVLFVVLTNIGRIFGVFGNIFDALFPVIIGFVLAFVFNVPMRGFENLITRIFKKAKHKPGPKLKRFISLILLLISISLVVIAAVRLVVPLLTESFTNIYDALVRRIPELSKFLSEKNIDISALTTWISEHDNINELVKSIAGGAFSMLASVFAAAAGAVSSLFSVFLTVFVAIYALLSKDKLVMQSKRVCESLLSEKAREKLYYAANMLNFKYSKFLSGQCIEACILGVLGFLVLIIFQVPNAFVIAFITAVLAFVPFVGAFCAFGIGAIITLITEPEKLITYIIIYFVVQIVETQFICPHVVGNSVGLSPLWTLIAVFIGGNLLGLIGMILFIPLFSVIVTLFHEYVDKRHAKKVASGELPKDEQAPPLQDQSSEEESKDVPSEEAGE